MRSLKYVGRIWPKSKINTKILRTVESWKKAEFPELSIEIVRNVISNMAIHNGLCIEHLWFTEQKQNILYHGDIISVKNTVFTDKPPQFFLNAAIQFKRTALCSGMTE